MVQFMLLDLKDGKKYSPEEDGINILCPESGLNTTDTSAPYKYHQTCNPGTTASIIQIFLIETFATGVFVSQYISLKYNSQIKEGITAGISVGITLFAMLTCS